MMICWVFEQYKGHSWRKSWVSRKPLHYNYREYYVWLLCHWYLYHIHVKNSSCIYLSQLVILSLFSKKNINSNIISFKSLKIYIIIKFITYKINKNKYKLNRTLKWSKKQRRIDRVIIMIMEESQLCHTMERTDHIWF